MIFFLNVVSEKLAFKMSSVHVCMYVCSHLHSEGNTRKPQMFIEFTAE